MKSKKIYLQPISTVFNGILDIVELQKGKVTFSDSPNGKVNFIITMYGSKWELKFHVIDIGKNRTCVNLEIGGEPQGREDLIRREFAFIDSILIENAHIEIFEATDDG